MSDPLNELFARIKNIHQDFYPKDVSCIGEIATEFLRFKEKFVAEKKPLWANNTECPAEGCGKPIDPKIRSAETGFNYCSNECATKDVEENWSDKGDEGYE